MLAKMLAQPSHEELFRLKALCGGNEESIVALLAKTYKLSPTAIAPTVRQWLAELPAAPPPSRQRSSPPVLATAPKGRTETRSSALAARPPDVLPIRTPPASAPVLGSSDVVAAMRALDSRLNRQTVASNSTRVLPDVKAQRAEFHTAFRPMLPSTVPEEAEDEGGAGVDAALAATWRARQAQSILEPSGIGMKRDPVRSTWMTRATPQVRF
jgi:hypothetical protein